MKLYIKKLLRESFLKEKTENLAVGVLIKCTNTNKILLVLRNETQPTWSLISGSLEDGEKPLEALKREVSEELSINPEIIKYKKIGVQDIPEKNMKFHYYEGFTSDEFTPKLNDEHTDWGWFHKEKLPTPLYKGTKEKVKNI